MSPVRILTLAAIAISLAGASAFAAGGVRNLSVGEFRALAEKLAPKVNLFRDVWKQDPRAEFYGGTTRDYLYWLKGQFRGVTTREQALAKIRELEALTAIDVSDFIVQESDADVVSSEDIDLEKDRYGVRKIDQRGAELFDPKTAAGQNELLQGYIPAEKIRLSKKGFVESPAFGDGIGEIYSGKVTVHFASAEDFAKSHYARQGLNHPVLLALRYLRLVSVNYFQEHGSGYPDLNVLLNIDPKSRAAVMKVIDGTLDGKTLVPFLEKEQFKKWMNASLRKSLRSHTNATAAHELLKAFKVDKLLRVYGGLDPINQALFAKHRDPAKVAEAFRSYGVRPSEVFLSVRKTFGDGMFYHGTKTDEDFRSILLEGFIASERGDAGPGLYGVPTRTRSFAEQLAGDPARLVGFRVNPGAKIVDIRGGAGKKLWDRFRAATGGNLDRFAETFGIDMIRYPYRTEAYVVKNASAVSKPEGVYRQILTLSSALPTARALKSRQELDRFLSSFAMSGFNPEEASRIADQICASPIAETYAKTPAEKRYWKEAFRFFVRAGTGDLDPENEPFLKKLRKAKGVPDPIYDLLASIDRPTEQLTDVLAEKSPRSLLPRLRRVIAAKKYDVAGTSLLIWSLEQAKTTDPDVRQAVSEVFADVSRLKPKDLNGNPYLQATLRAAKDFTESYESLVCGERFSRRSRTETNAGPTGSR